MDMVTSPGERGAAIISTIFPIIFPINSEEDEWENACWIICIAIKPGARKLIKDTPRTFPLSLPIANEITNKNKIAVIYAEGTIDGNTDNIHNGYSNTLKKVFEFLNVPDFKIKDIEKKNVRKYDKMLPETRKLLIEYYKPYNKKLEEFLNMKFNWN